MEVTGIEPVCTNFQAAALAVMLYPLNKVILDDFIFDNTNIDYIFYKSQYILNIYFFYLTL